MPNKVVLYAPNVHAGGGGVLLKVLLAAWAPGELLYAVLDSRAQASLVIPPSVIVLQWVRPTLLGRLHAEWVLRTNCTVGDEVLCFHGLPPLLRNPARIVVFFQNRLYLGLTSLAIFPRRTALRLAVERLWSRYLRLSVAEYLVQTPTMQHDLVHWYTGGDSSASKPHVNVLPFMGPIDSLANLPTTPEFEWDFVYVAEGIAHKNHRVLIEAWCELAKHQLFPRLALTLGPQDCELLQLVETMRATYGVEIHNLGKIPHKQVLALYRRSHALIFPSLTESFGLPLIEAQQFGVPIIASELDYVRDICQPVQTFDPMSARSIARAVRRFLGVSEPLLKIKMASEFWQAVLRHGYPLADDK